MSAVVFLKMYLKYVFTVILGLSGFYSWVLTIFIKDCVCNSGTCTFANVIIYESRALNFCSFVRVVHLNGQTH